jgi:pyruvate dehydrogenase E1 component alpha subunit
MANPPEPESTRAAVTPTPNDEVHSARALPDPETAREWLQTMTLIRRFEERAGEMYARAQIGGFLHLSIGEEATIVGSARALRDKDYLVSTYRSHGHALVRGTPPENVMAELFGRVDGCCKGRGGSMHMFDLRRRFMGGYGIVGGNLPIAAGVALACDYSESEDVVLCTLGDGASNQGTFGETMNLAALWRLPVVFLVTNNQFGMGTAVERHSAVTELRMKGEGFGVPGKSCDGMDVLDTYTVLSEALASAREERRPLLVEAITYRFRGHSMADPEQYRTREQVERWRRRDPLAVFGERLREEGVLDERELQRIDAEALARVDAAVAFAEESPFPEPGSLYDDVYALGAQVHGWYSLAASAGGADGRDGAPAGVLGEDARRAANDEIPQQLTEALAAAEDVHRQPEGPARDRQPEGPPHDRQPEGPPRDRQPDGPSRKGAD